MSARVCRRLLVSGRVQGVWYRGSMQSEAERLGLCGWVRNLGDGRVEAVVEGSAEAVERITAWCAEGPPGARVEAVETREEPTAALVGFSIKY